jgi:hypothetical protein
MAENVEGHRGRRGRWLVLAVLLAIAVWVVRSRRATRASYGEEWQLPEEAAPRGGALISADQDGLLVRASRRVTRAPVRSTEFR